VKHVSSKNTGALDTMVISKTSIQLPHTSVVGIGDHDCRTSSGGPPDRRRKPYLVGPREQIGVIFYEVVVVVHDGVRRIHKDKVICCCLVDGLFKVGDLN